MKGKTHAIGFALAIAAITPIFADPSPSGFPPAQRCDLKPINPWKFQYAGCRDTTNYKTLNQYLALNLGPSRDFDQYRFYRGIENKVFPVSLTVAAAFLPLPVYLTAIGVTVPLNVFVSRQRIRYLRILVGKYNAGL